MLLVVKRVLFPFYELLHYRKIILWNAVKSRVGKKTNNIFLFILSAPFSGSTLLAEILSTCSAVSPNNTLGTREGQQLPGVRTLIWNRPDKYDSEAPLDWITIKRKWLKFWDVTKPILLEKSPPNIAHASIIEHHFRPAYFICLVRDPYAQCESHLSSHTQMWASASEVAQFVMKCMRFQKSNVENLNSVIVITYEDLTAGNHDLKEKLATFLPLLSDIKFSGLFKDRKSNRKVQIRNLNMGKIEKLSDSDLVEINAVFENNRDILNFFNYKIISRVMPRS